MSMELLDLHIKLLLLEHGKDRVLASLARVADVSEADVRKQLESVKPKVTKTRAKPTVDAVLARLNVSPTRRELLVTIAREFEQKRFLGELRLVGKFLREHEVRTVPKSRIEALPKVLSLLAAMPEDELRSVARDLANGTSELGFADLAGAIMRPVR